MRNKILVTMLLAALLPASAPATAAHAARKSPFSAEEQTVIRRNALLAPLARRDPLLLRRTLDALEKSKGEPAAAQDRSGLAPAGDALPDRAHNPDLDQMLQASPEATLELIQLIKKAGGGRRNN
jgi:hypothetical protein